MESTIPDTGVFARNAADAADFQNALRTGEWSYPNSLGIMDTNISVIFDFILLVGFLITWLIQVIMKQNEKEKPPTASVEREEAIRQVKEKCVAGKRKSGYYGTTGVAFITKDEYSLLLSTAIALAFVFFKIICGAHGVTSGYIFVISICALFMRFIHQAGKDRVWMMFTTVLALICLFLGFLAYTESIPGKKSGEKSGQNLTYIFSGVLLLLAGVLKTIMTLNYAAGIGDTETYIQKRAEAIVDGDWLYELSGVSVIVTAAGLITFVFTEAITIALAATKWYAVPFYALYPIAFYFIIKVPCQMFDNNALATIFNTLMVIIATFIVIMLQGHACSLPGSDVGEFATGSSPYCPRFAGLKRSTEAGLKLHKGWTITLEIFTAIFLVGAYWCMIFTSRVNKNTVRALCIGDDSKYEKHAA